MASPETIGPATSAVEAPPAGPRRTMSPLMVRVLSAAVLVAVLLSSLVAGPTVALPVLTILIMVGTWEYYAITRRMGVAAAPWVLFPLTLVLLFRFQIDAVSPQLVPLALTIAIGAGLAVYLVARQPVDGMSRWAMAIAGSLYIGWMLGFYFALYTAHEPDPARIGTALLLALAGSTVLGDTAALLAGTRFGRHSFFPGISPHKTVEGAVAGFVVQALVFSCLGLLADIPVGHGVVLGAMVALAAQAGDLVESQFKRAAKVKDAGNLVPGHGGMLDRIDSLILIPAVAYYYLELVLHVKLPQ
ncbi:MAG TPA: phosphatidate cytidylyltransferase [Candidatus Solibacter sp.]|nr:phosphatidate cytidylyltransferase [Candidatus Solibacter sp.]